MEPTYLTSTREHLRVRQPSVIGRRIAAAVGRFKYGHQRYPGIKEFSYYLRNTNEPRISRNEAHLLKNLPLRATNTTGPISSLPPSEVAFRSE